VTHEVGQEREQQMRFVAQIAAQWAAGTRLDRFQGGAQGERFVFGHAADRREIAVLAILRDLGLGQSFRHGSAPAASTCAD
jgi:hypothetical protein